MFGGAQVGESEGERDLVSFVGLFYGSLFAEISLFYGSVFIWMSCTYISSEKLFSNLYYVHTTVRGQVEICVVYVK